MASLVVVLLLVGLFALSYEANPNYQPIAVEKQAQVHTQPRYKVLF